ncbi:hypothetical protein K439DRAFT_1295431, partial [Ramaria rubella]
ECFTLKQKSEREAKEKKRKKGKEKAHKVEEESVSESESTSDSSSSEDVHISKALMARIQAYITMEPKAKTNDILIDSGASCHMTPHQHWFVPGSYKHFATPQKVHFGDNSFAEASRMGSVCFESKSSGNMKKITSTNVLHVPVFS